MRLYLTADSKSKPGFHLPWDYHLSMQSAIYEALDRYAPERATELHQLPHDPPFTFSEFIATAPYTVGDDGITFNRGFFAVTSDETDILDSIASHATAGDITIGHTKLPVIGTDIEPVHGVRKATYRTLSPVCVTQTIDGRREYLRPQDGMWFARVRESVHDRLAHEWGLPDDFEFSVDQMQWVKPKRLRISGFDGQANCARFEADIRTDVVTSEFIQEYGLGERTGMGFGSVMPTDHLPAEAI